MPTRRFHRATPSAQHAGRLASPLSAPPRHRLPSFHHRTAGRPPRGRRRSRRGGSGRSRSWASPCSKRSSEGDHRPPAARARMAVRRRLAVRPAWCWMWFLTAPGYLAGRGDVRRLPRRRRRWAAPRGPWRVIGRPAAHTLAEALRFVFPFGGVPLASLAIGQAAGPFARRRARRRRAAAHLVRVPGRLRARRSVAGRAALARKRGITGEGRVARRHRLARRHHRLAGEPRLADGTSAVASGASIAVAVVQGGGPAGNARHRHIRGRGAATPPRGHRHHRARVGRPRGVAGERHRRGHVRGQRASSTLVAAEAERIGAPFAVGITEDTADGEHFLNAQVVVTPDGEVYRAATRRCAACRSASTCRCAGCSHALGAPTDLVPRDAVAGTGPAVLELPDGTRHGARSSRGRCSSAAAPTRASRPAAQFIINPTNGSSYTWTVLQSQQVASSRLRAIEQNRWVVQASPTGFSAFVSPDGDVFDRTSVSEQEVITRTIDRRAGPHLVLAHRQPAVGALMALLLAASLWRGSPVAADSARGTGIGVGGSTPPSTLTALCAARRAIAARVSMRGRPEVRNEHRVLALEQAGVHRRLVLEHVEAGAGDLPRLQRRAPARPRRRWGRGRCSRGTPSASSSPTRGRRSGGASPGCTGS